MTKLTIFSNNLRFIYILLHFNSIIFSKASYSFFSWIDFSSSTYNNSDNFVIFFSQYYLIKWLNLGDKFIRKYFFDKKDVIFKKWWSEYPRHFSSFTIILFWLFYLNNFYKKYTIIFSYFSPFISFNSLLFYTFFYFK